MSLASKALSRLTKVELREVWSSESAEFTPWLAQPENLVLLGEAIDLELELEAQEKDVGPFRADILCKDTATGDWVLIENQLERTDHSHLGQLLTYAAGLKAVTIVWVAAHFTEEHRAALDWLNEITDDEFSFFGLEVELWKIADSPVAPKFNLVCKPNDWSKGVKQGVKGVESGELTESKRLQLEFWQSFREFADGQTKVIRLTKPLPQHWMNMSIGRTGFRLTAIASLYDSVAGTFDSHEVRVELVLDGDQSKVHFEMLKSMLPEIERQLGHSLTWHASGGKLCRIYVRLPADLHDRSRWPEYQQWLLKETEAFHRVLAPIVKQLNAAEHQPAVASTVTNNGDSGEGAM